MSNMAAKQDQRGMVSFMVTLVMIAVISLIVMGFSQVIRHNARESLDRQLSAEAFYAAESGVNVTKASIASYLAAGTTLPTKTTCPKNYDSTSSSIVPLDGAAGKVLYSCVLVNPTPTNLTYNSVGEGTSVFAPIHAEAGLKTLTFTWSPQLGFNDGGNAARCAGRYYQMHSDTATWNCSFPLLRIDLMQAPGGASTIPNSADALNTNTASFFVSPYGDHLGGIYDNTSSTAPYHLTTLAYGGANPTSYFGSGCTTPGLGSTCTPAGMPCNTTYSNYCMVTIPLNGSLPDYYARITPIYSDSSQIVVSGTISSGAAHFANSQAVVDVTGKAQDELKRVQVRVSLTGSPLPGSIPNSAISSSSDICKAFGILPTGSITSTAATACP